MDKLLQRKRSNRKTTIIHGVPSSTTTTLTPTTPLPKPSIKNPQTHYISLLSELSAHETALLARLLNTTNFSGRNASDLSSLIASLPAHLKSGSRLLGRLPKGVTNLPASALLCAAHKPLNGRVVRSILNSVKEEVGWKLSTVVAFGGSELTNHHRLIINVVREIHALWMDQSTFSKNLVTTGGNGNPKWIFELSRCEACILSRIGASAETLQALRTVILSRTQTRDPRKRPPSLLRWVEAWIDTGIGSGNDKVEIRYLSAEYAKDLKVVRKLAHLRRREAEGRKAREGRRRTHHPHSSSQDQIKEGRDEGAGAGTPASRPSAHKGDDRETDSDPENAIIDSYDNVNLDPNLNLLSPEFLPTLSLSRLDLSRKPEDTPGMTHPAFRDSHSIQVADAGGAYGEGSYKPVGRDGAEGRAEEYRSLLLGENWGDGGDDTDASVYSQDEDENEAVGSGSGGSTLVDAQRPGAGTSDVSRVTRWEDMYGK
jgi:hypothetical protein